jgi:prepilin-type processing-associated H-X9-DG protein
LNNKRSGKQLPQETMVPLPFMFPFGASPWLTDFQPFMTDVSTFRCPSDPGLGLPASGRSNYAACLGDHIRLTNGGGRNEYGFYQSEITNNAGMDQSNAASLSDSSAAAEEARGTNRGMFWMRHSTTFRDVLDGLSNTIACGEIATGRGDLEVRSNILHLIPGILPNPQTAINVQACLNQVDPMRPAFYVAGNQASNAAGASAKGFVWGDARLLYTGCMTILPPNKASCVMGRDKAQGFNTVSSQHQGGAHVLMGDGAVKFITDSIEAGDYNLTPTVGGESPYGLWGALGTRAMSEVIDKDF